MRDAKLAQRAYKLSRFPRKTALHQEKDENYFLTPLFFLGGAQAVETPKGLNSLFILGNPLGSYFLGKPPPREEMLHQRTDSGMSTNKDLHLLF